MRPRFPRTPYDDPEDFELTEPPSPVSSHQKLEALMQYLKDNYQPRCKAPGEDLEAHLRYAGAVGLAQHIIRTYGGT